jgi:hypothetical protein
MVNVLRVMNFWTSVKLLQVCADRLEQYGETAVSATETSSFQKTCNRKLLANFLRFSFITCMSKSDKQWRSYECWNTVHRWKNLEYNIWFGLTMISQNSADWIRCRIRKSPQCESDREFGDVSRKHKYALIWPTVQELWSLKVGRGISSGQIKLSGQIWTFSPLPKEFWGNYEYQYPREFYILSNGG